MMPTPSNVRKNICQDERLRNHWSSFRSDSRRFSSWVITLGDLPRTPIHPTVWTAARRICSKPGVHHAARSTREKYLRLQEEKARTIASEWKSHRDT